LLFEGLGDRQGDTDGQEEQGSGSCRFHEPYSRRIEARAQTFGVGRSALKTLQIMANWVGCPLKFRAGSPILNMQTRLSA